MTRVARSNRAADQLAVMLAGRIRKTRKGGCWFWVGRNGRPTTRMRVSGVQFEAHSLLWQLVHGGMYGTRRFVLEQTCTTEGCVNPDHYRKVTVSELMKARAPTHCPSGHPLSGSNVYVTKRGHRKCRACNAEIEKRRRARDGGVYQREWKRRNREHVREYERKYRARRRAEKSQ